MAVTTHVWYLVALPLFLVAAIVQASTGAGPQLLGARPDLLLVLVTTWAIVRSPEETMLAAPPAALLAGMLGAGAVGIPVLAILLPIALALLLRSSRQNRLATLVVAVTLATAWLVLLDLTISFLTGEHGLRLSGVGHILAAELTLNLGLAVVFFLPLRFNRRRQMRRRSRLSLS